MIRQLTLCALLCAGLGSLAAEDKPAAPADGTKVERLKPEQWCWTHDLLKGGIPTFVLKRKIEGLTVSDILELRQSTMDASGRNRTTLGT